MYAAAEQVKMGTPIEKPRAAESDLPKYLTQLIIVFVAYFVAGKLGQATTSIRSSNLGPVWPAYGVAVAAVLMYGYRIWPGIFAAASLVAFLSPVIPSAAIGQASGATFAALIAGVLLNRVVGFQRSMSRLRDALGLILLGALGSALISSLIGTVVLYATHITPYEGLASAWFIYWLGDGTGVLLVTPLLLTLSSLLQIRERKRMLELGVVVLLSIAASFFVFGDLSLFHVRLHVLAFSVLPFIMWAAIRFEVSGAALSILLVATIATLETALGSGPFSANTQFMNAVLLDIFFGVLSVTGLTLGATIAEREEGQRVREQLIREQALHQREAELIEAQRVGHLGSWLWDVKTGKVTWSQELYRLYALDPALPAPTYEDHAKLLTADSWRALQSEVEKALRTGAFYELDLEILRASGATRWIRGRGEALRDATGKIIQLRGTAVDITERKRAEETLRESEERFRSIFRDAVVGMVIVSPRGHFLAANDAFCDCLGYSEGELRNKTVQSIIFHEDWPSFVRVLANALNRGESFRKIEKRCVHRSGRILFTESSGSVIRGLKGSAKYFVGEVLDVTERKKAVAALSSVNRRLIEAQEQERARIARELHDDIGQRLALMTIALGELKAELGTEESRPADHIRDLLQQASSVSADLQAISHRLHSSKLEVLGLVAAIRAFCREFSAQQKLRIEFLHDERPLNLPYELSLCFFRVLQEALHNAAKYSQVRHFEVRLRSTPSEIHLAISDTGIGFDPKSTSSMQGLGLVSMQERAKLANGTLTIESKPMGGTTVHLRVPSKSEWIAGPLDQVSTG
jgi:PAS domain S-box-containing protein